MSKFSKVSGTLCVAALVAGLVVPRSVSAETLRMSTLKQPESAGAAATKRFAELVEEKTGGELKVRVYPASQLGDWTEVYEQVIEGAVDMAMQPLATSSDKRLAITWFPYAFTNYETAQTSLKPGGGVFEIVRTVIGEQGLTPLAVYGAGMGGAGFVTDVADPASTDLDRNLKVRVWPGGTTHKVLLEEFGYNTAALPWDELYTGMQTGVVDGQIGGTPVMAIENFNDITKTWIQFNDHFESDYFFINSDRFESLSKAHQAAIQEAAVQVADEQFEAVKAADEAALETMRGNGVTVVTFTDDELDALANTARTKVWPQIAGELGEETLDMLMISLGLK